MKNIFIFITTMPVIFQIYTMDEYSIVRTVRGNHTSYTLETEPLPVIKIDECNTCGEASTTKCSACKLVFYCNRNCQTKDWKKHKKDCPKLQKTHCGDIAHMRTLFSAYVKKAEATADETRRWNYIKTAILWHLKTIIRLQQDIACSKDISTQGATEKVNFDHRQMLSSLKLSQEQLQLIVQESKLKAFEWAKHLTDKDKLVPPFEIRLYGMKAFIQSLKKDEEFYPESEWPQKRKEALQKLLPKKLIKSARKR